MVDFNGKPRLGRYILTRQLAPGVLGDRWLAVHELDQTSHVVHWIRCDQGCRHAGKRVISALERASELDQDHILKIEAFSLDARGLPWAVTPFTGDQDGVLTLDRLLRHKEGYLSVAETKRAMDQLLSASVFAHSWGRSHGALSMPEVVVDKRGSLSIEHYGVARDLSTSPVDQDRSEHDEVRSIAIMGYQMLTGLRYEHPLILPTRVIERLDQHWDGWFEVALGPTGYASSAHARSALQDCPVPGEALGLNGASNRVRRALDHLLFTE